MAVQKVKSRVVCRGDKVICCNCGKVITRRPYNTAKTPTEKYYVFSIRCPHCAKSTIVDRISYDAYYSFI